MEKAMTQQRKTSKKPAAQSSATASMQQAQTEAKPKKTASRSKKGMIVTPEMRHQMISDAAYYLSEKRGAPNGEDHFNDWLAAESEIDAMLAKTGKLS